MNYRGKERRIHRVFVTRNTEYHLRNRLCVGVRDRRSGRWLPTHLATRTRVEGGLSFNLRGGLIPNRKLPSVGESLFFCEGNRDLITSPVIAIERPVRDVVESYAH